MKNLRLLFVGLSIVSVSFFSSCAGESSNEANDNADSTQVQTEADASVDELSEDAVSDDASLGTEYTSAYICPNHCEGSGSEVEGDCPTCGMEYMENPNAVETEK